MKPKVVAYKKIPKEIEEFIAETCEITFCGNLNDENRADFLEKIQEAAGLIGSGLKVDKELLDQMPALKIVSNMSVGYDNLDVQELTKRHILATNTPDVLNETTADTIFGLLLATARRFPELHNYVKDGRWKEIIGEDLFGVDVHHKVLGIIGMGRIGTVIAKRAHLGFGMEILYHNRSRHQEAEHQYGATYCSLDELLQKSDFVCLMTPLTPHTEHLIGEREFRLMKKTAIFINGSRGKTVNEQDLVRALENREILAAGLDVFQKEPIDPDHPLLKLENVVLLPHVGSATYETRFAMAKLAAENLVKGLQGEHPPSLINPEVLGK
ncbi:2-hydroxyacid dehydrogenase [Effusibacillus dendaii]|uniref:Glyoxylate/hydroxypyruvate reductase B n=1 Tax=Effusibacillus dendaii TaxID=2743772 RepID=A0A7I8DG55_9BACL|nr:D-glycerate dehydrogenase [Effusibacillus dendaii]BCJ88302.1 bifunctional glyoxylate/hydroxypyruvate reductase B [Effusibacillus dendaii]